MNQIVSVETPTNAIAITGVNPFEAFADAVAPKYILGKLLKFAKGDYLAGETSEIVPLGTRLVAGMDCQLVGWVRWDAGKPVEHRMVRIVDGKAPQRRADLGDHDQSQWERDSQGQLRDPWCLSHYLPMVDQTQEVFTYATTSRGGTGALADLARYYGKQLRVHPDEFPVIELQVGAYQHQNPQFGRIKFPEFKRVGWEPKNTFWRLIGTDDAAVESEQTERTTEQRSADGFSDADDIPF
jgi:hypothetical protein